MHVTTLAKFADTFTQLDFDLINPGVDEAAFDAIFERLALLSTPLAEREHRWDLATQTADVVRIHRPTIAHQLEEEAAA
jgi:hypothetical protein